VGLLVSKPKVYALKDFVAAAEHEHSISADTLQLRHTGDFARISVKQHPGVTSIIIVAKKRVQKHNIGFAGSNTDYSDKTSTESKTVGAAADLEYTVKEQYGTAVAGVIPYTEYIDDVDITLTLKSVTLMDGTDGVIGQDPTAPGALINEDIINAVGWVLGGLACIMAAYIGYRLWRHYRHGEAMFPRLQKLAGGE
jgi:hypothetical protein